MNRSDIDKISLETLAQQAPSHLCWIVFSSLGLTTNLLVLITITFTKSLHNSSQYVVFTHALAEVVYMSAYFATGLARYLASALSNPQTSDHVTCAFKQTPLNATSGSLRAAVLALAVDRCLCVGLPIFYRNMRTRNYIVGVNVLIWSYGCTQALIGFAYLQLTPSLIPICAYAIIFDQTYSSAATIVANVGVGMIAALYFCAVLIAFVRRKKTRFTGETQRREWKRRMQFDVLVVISIIGVIFLVCTGVTSVLSAISVRLNNIQSKFVFVLFSTFAAFVSSISHLFVYLMFNSQFRKGFRVIFCRSNPSVSPMGS